MAPAQAQICVSGQIHFDDINLERDYDCKKSYRQSKLANVLFCKELAARLQGDTQSQPSSQIHTVALN